MDDKKADIIAVAKAARVSASTVSRSFNHPELVKATTRRRIDNAVRKLGYIRNRAAQTIHGIRSGTIGLVVPTIDHAIFAEVIQSFSDGVEEHGFTILLAAHGYDLDREYALVRKMLEHRVDGLALVGMNHVPDTFEVIRRQNLPAVLIWNHAADAELPTIGASNTAAGTLIAQHVLDLGHRDIAVMYPPLAGNDRAEGRLRAVEALLGAQGHSIPDALRLEVPYSITAAKAAAADLFARARPTALICANDVLAWGAHYAATRAGFTIPDDITITGIGDFKGSRDLEPALTTVRVPAREIGRTAADQLSQAIGKPDFDILSRPIEPVLMIRQSSAPPSTI